MPIIQPNCSARFINQAGQPNLQTVRFLPSGKIIRSGRPSLPTFIADFQSWLLKAGYSSTLVQLHRADKDSETCGKQPGLIDHKNVDETSFIAVF